MDNNNNVIVSVKLNASGFEDYYCKGRFVAGINVGNMFRLIKSIGQSDTLLMRVDEKEPNLLKMQIENFDKNMRSLLRAQPPRHRGGQPRDTGHDVSMSC